MAERKQVTGIFEQVSKHWCFDCKGGEPCPLRKEARLGAIVAITKGNILKQGTVFFCAAGPKDTILLRLDENGSGTCVRE